MLRVKSIPRVDRKEKLEEIGFSYHDWDNWWIEDASYAFRLEQIEEIETATNDLHEMCMQVVEKVVGNDYFLKKLNIPEKFWDAVANSYKHGDFSLYGRFDLVYDGFNPPKMLEYNADTPTSLLEAAVAQWYWLKDVHPTYDQFNSIHERLVQEWERLGSRSMIHFASLNDVEEDWVCTYYLMETAIQAGYDVKHVYLEDIAKTADGQLLDQDNCYIDTVFKLYPWEWMMREDFQTTILTSHTKFIEPLWKSVLSNKGILPILWDMFPNHPNLLPAYFTPNHGMQNFVKKPLFSREGANIEVYRNGILTNSGADQDYGGEGHIYQQLVEIPKMDDRYPLIGSWVIGGAAGGMGIRESKSLITDNMGHFVPHYFIE